MFKFKSLEPLGLSHRIPGKIKKAINSYAAISALVPEIFNCEKCWKYANVKTDNIIYSTQCNIKYINTVISVNLQQRPLKIGRLISCVEAINGKRKNRWYYLRTLRMHSEVSAKRSPTGEQRGFLIPLARQGGRKMCDWRPSSLVLSTRKYT